MAVDGFYNGMGLYIPSAPTKQKIHFIASFIGATNRCNIEPVEQALTSPPANNVGYMISQGAFGYAASNLTGVIAPVPFRVFYDLETNENVCTLILPTGENAYSLWHVQFQTVKSGSGDIRDDKLIAASPALEYRFKAPAAYIPAIRMRAQNLYREGGSDGFGPWSFYAPGFQFDSSKATNLYNPGSYPPVLVDRHANINRPTSGYPSY